MMDTRIATVESEVWGFLRVSYPEMVVDLIPSEYYLMRILRIAIGLS
jgi:hypothetical protein